MDIEETLPVAVIGAGPVGLAAAAHLVERGIPPLLFEKGSRVGTSLLDWGHVRVFSPWSYNVDSAASRLLAASGWNAPDPTGLPTGRDLVEAYLEPLAGLPSIASGLRLGATVTAVTRRGLDKMSDAGRDKAPFEIRWTGSDGERHRSLARAVVDASGTWGTPNPLGSDGLPVPGEEPNRDRIAYGIPDVSGTERDSYAGRRVLVVGSGHSAINVALDLLRLKDRWPDTEVLWAIRRKGIERLLGGLSDQLPERGALGLAAKAAMDDGRLEVLRSFAADRIERIEDRLRVHGRWQGQAGIVDVDRIVVATGLRPDLSFLREVRVQLEPSVEAPPALAPLIDPNLHSCGSVPPHGAAELAHPERDFYIVGSKSYGRAPTFLMVTGYEQVRSVVAKIAGDEAAAREVRLVLPETGVCGGVPASAEAEGTACCGGPAPTGSDACCADDHASKTTGAEGCGCGTALKDPVPAPAASGCCGPTRVMVDA